MLSLTSEGFRRFLASEGSRRFLVRAGKMVSRTHTVSQLVGFEVKFLTRLNLGILKISLSLFERDIFNLFGEAGNSLCSRSPRRHTALGGAHTHENFRQGHR